MKYNYLNIGILMKNFSIILFLFVIYGCASNTATIQKVGLNYYLIGDSNCVRASEITYGIIRCYNLQGEVAAQRSAMTAQDMQIYMYQKQQEELANQRAAQSIVDTLNSVTNQINQNTALINQSTQNMMNMNQNYNWSPVNQKSIVNCYRAGNLISCR